MKECDILEGGSKHTLTPHTYFHPPQPHDLRDNDSEHDTVRSNDT